MYNGQHHPAGPRDDLFAPAVLERAAALIETRGLACGEFSTPGGGVLSSGCPLCTAAAICVAAGLPPNWFAISRNLACPPELALRAEAARNAVLALAERVGIPRFERADTPGVTGDLPLGQVYSWSDSREGRGAGAVAALRAAAWTAAAA